MYIIVFSALCDRIRTEQIQIDDIHLSGVVLVVILIILVTHTHTHTFSFGGAVFVDGVDVSKRCRISISIVNRSRAGSGLLFPSLIFTIPVRTCFTKQKNSAGSNSYPQHSASQFVFCSLVGLPLPLSYSPTFLQSLLPSSMY